jgi:hypothetical protein
VPPTVVVKAVVWATDDEDDVLVEGGGERQVVRCHWRPRRWWEVTAGTIIVS